MKITGIYIYPIKGMGGISLQSSKVEIRGLEHDRRWLLIDENKRFLTQREFPEMALLQPYFSGSNLMIKHKNKSIEPIAVPLSLPSNPERITVQIWKDECEAVLLDSGIDRRFSEILGTKCRLVYMPDSANRKLEDRFYTEGDVVSFADAFPISIFGMASIEDLNSKLSDPVSINRFRPNFVFEGGKSFVEEEWKLFKIGEVVVFRGFRPSGRCQVITTNQETAEKNKEPLKTLSTYRKKDGKVLFGMGVGLDRELTKIIPPTVNLGDEIEVLK